MTEARTVSRYRNARVTFSWNALRVLMVQKFHQEQERYGPAGWNGKVNLSVAAKDIGINDKALGEFLRGVRPTLVLENTLPILAWLGIHDWRELCEGEGMDDED